MSRSEATYHLLVFHKSTPAVSLKHTVYDRRNDVQNSDYYYMPKAKGVLVLVAPYPLGYSSRSLSIIDHGPSFVKVTLLTEWDNSHY